MHRFDAEGFVSERAGEARWLVTGIWTDAPGGLICICGQVSARECLLLTWFHSL